MRTLVLLLLLALSVGCHGRSLESSPTENPDFDVQTLFTHDGCTVYRFWDALEYRYFVRCGNAEASTTWGEDCGKGCRRQMVVPTESRP